MKLANQDQVQAIDPEFGRMATQVGIHAWSLPHLTMREKTFVFLAADLCTANVGFPLLTHVNMAQENGVSAAECVAAIRHLAPYVGYPTAAMALKLIKEHSNDDSSAPPATDTSAVPRLDDALEKAFVRTDSEFREFAADQYNQRWSGADLTPRERALACIAADVVNQTLEDSFALHIDLATAAGAREENIRAVLLLVAEYGIAKSWRAFRAMHAQPRA
jgi:4-carboxymuconolactone decarboxylase